MIQTIVTSETLGEIAGRLMQKDTFGLDTETTGLLWADRMFSLIIATDDETFYFNFNSHVTSPVGTLLTPSEVKAALHGVFMRRDVTWYIHNAKFDMKMLWKESIYLYGTIKCTYAGSRILKNNRIGGHAYSLASLSRDWLGKEKDSAVEEYVKKNKLSRNIPIDGKEKEYKEVNYHLVPFEMITRYAFQDALLHYELGQFIDHHIPQELQTLWRNEQEFTKACLQMEINGLRIDRSYTRAAMEFERGLVREAMDSFHALTGCEYDNKKGTLIKVFEAEGVKIPLTAKGNPSLTDDVLDTIESPAANLIRTIRYHEKRISSFYSSFLFYADQNDIVHADFRQAGTETGRLSCREPNIQQLPKEDTPEDFEQPFLVRKCFVPKPGKIYVSIDYKQQEYRVMADYAGEKALIDEIMAGKDVHQATAELVGVTRGQAKTLNFAILYGAGAERIAKMLGISVAEATHLRALYFAKLPHVNHFIKTVRKKGETRGYIFNWIGRRNHIADPSFAFILPNHLIQGSCADVVKKAMNELHGRFRGLEIDMVAQIHDEILFEMNESQLSVVPDIQKVMESIYPSKNGIILTTDAKWSRVSMAAKDMVKYE